MTTTKTTTKPANITDQLKKAPSIALTYNEMISAENDVLSSVTKFVQEFKGANLEKFDALNIELHLWENWKFRTKNGVKCSDNATKKPAKTATKLSAIRTYLKHDNKITNKTTYEDIKQFQNAINSSEDSPEMVLKKDIAKNLKGLDVKQLKAIKDFIKNI